MKFYLRLTMEGKFTGSPDHITCEISESDYDEIANRFKQQFNDAGETNHETHNH